MEDVSHQEIIGLWIRLWRRTTVDPVTGCWIWHGARHRFGYGMIGFLRRTVTTHRVARVIFGDDFDQDLTLDHLCRNPPCWRMDHLDPCTRAENVMRGVGACAEHARKTHCIHGHPLTPDNLLPSTRGRECRTCAHENQQRRQDRLRAARLNQAPP